MYLPDLFLANNRYRLCYLSWKKLIRKGIGRKKVHFLPKWSNREPYFPSYLEWLRNWTKIYEGTDFKILDIRQWRAVIFKRWGWNDVSLTNAPVYHLERISRLQCSKGEPKRSLLLTLSWGGGASREFTVVRVFRVQHQRGESCMEW